MDRFIGVCYPRSGFFFENIFKLFTLSPYHSFLFIVYLFYSFGDLLALFIKLI